MPYPKLMIMASFCWKINFPHNEIKINSVLSMMSLKLTINVVAFFLGHPVFVSISGLNFNNICTYLRHPMNKTATGKVHISSGGVIRPRISKKLMFRRAKKHGCLNTISIINGAAFFFIMPKWLYLFRLKFVSWSGQNLVFLAISLYKKVIFTKN